MGKWGGSVSKWCCMSLFFGEEYPTQNVLMISFRLNLGVNDFPAKKMNCFHEAHCTPKAHCLLKIIFKQAEACQL